jgi:hypothetical protein
MVAVLRYRTRYRDRPTARSPWLQDRFAYVDRSDYIDWWRDLRSSRKRTGARGKEIMMLLSRRTFFKLTGASTIGWYAAT